MAATAHTAVATPLAMPKRRVNHMPARPAYTTQTGDKPRGARVAERTYAQFLVEDDAHCFVCRRHTDHFAEHDGLVEAGLARYGKDGSVYRTDKWDAELAREINEREYQAYCAKLGLKP